jgi:glycine hydroxymethyltransferase
VVSYDVDHETGLIDYDQIRDMAKKCQPKLIIAGASAYPRAIDFKVFADIAHEVGAVLMVDMAHIAGLVAGGAHMSPVPYADIVTTTTHKTLRGPRGGLILAKEEFAKKLNSGVFPGTQGGPLEHVIAAKAICLKEAMSDDFKTYAHNVVSNAKVMASALLEEGFDLVTGGTDNHLMLADLRPMGITGKELQERCDANHITLNKNAIPNDPQKPSVTSGVRIGTAAVTTRGLGAEEMKKIAKCVAMTARDFEGTQAQVKATVADICEKFPLYK